MLKDAQKKTWLKKKLTIFKEVVFHFREKKSNDSILFLWCSLRYRQPDRKFHVITREGV